MGLFQATYVLVKKHAAFVNVLVNVLFEPYSGTGASKTVLISGTVNLKGARRSRSGAKALQLIIINYAISIIYVASIIKSIVYI